MGDADAHRQLHQPLCDPSGRPSAAGDIPTPRPAKRSDMISDPANPADMPELSRDEQLEMYRRMLLIRRFEETVKEFMDAAEMVGGAHLSLGQEGAIVGACAALRNDDWI